MMTREKASLVDCMGREGNTAAGKFVYAKRPMYYRTLRGLSYFLTRAESMSNKKDAACPSTYKTTAATAPPITA
jgi:hypothetical protein